MSIPVSSLSFLSEHNTNKTIVRPKIGNREKHQGKHGKYPKKLGKHLVKHEKMYMEMRGETCREFPLGGFLSHLVTSFGFASYIAGFSR